MIMCQCEHISHLESTNTPRFHEYGQAPASPLRCWFIGQVCVVCYLQHMPGTHLPLDAEEFERQGGSIAVLIDLEVSREFQRFLPQTNAQLAYAAKYARMNMAHGEREIYIAMRLRAIELVQEYRAAMLQ